ncbi:MarR family winged helix-turn-helix transcriptional regulator [Aeribacillus composti]|uniref:MarR family transcriptional regulator n=1 Tax=Aeribacillus pallidus TaxID=33936 RepID=A0A161YVS1_9BACI|nr:MULTISPECIES: MarR family winged helix-turn-helix transcriptional regulator [Aeribacillus]REJ21275.1 MAG: MarR family transcriptional regulator [Bacillaceae bacterium]ASS91245.1 MarR family transcriptional regulator [Aeribacillus pallidus]KZM52845.1 MarR family transcriptional regulator [Aeribacillus pallidus]MED0651005.1 MarR family winged helix-turn-helix transcriptional regulator [Aeribacillus composti]MED4488113.1 MarR family winged helix-turn-helix transcriptional regulator [Aeribacill
MENVRELFQVMTRRFGLLNKNCCSIDGVDISLVQSHILYEIDKREYPSMQQVAEVLGMDITTFSRQIQNLVKKGLVKKTPLPEDRRVYTLSLTNEGKFIATTIDREIRQYLEEVFSHMTEFEKETVIRSIKLLNECMGKSSVCCKPLF